MNLPKFQFVDLSTPLANPLPGEVNESNRARTPQISYRDHRDMLPTVEKLLGCKAEDLPGGRGWANEVITLSSHHGTHVDAPYHYFPTCGGQPAATISDLPLDRFFGPAIVLDLRHIPVNTTVSREEIQRALEKIDHRLRPGDIVCLYYGTDEKLGTPEYWTQYPGMSAEATEYVLQQGVQVMGTDAMGFDIPFEQIKKNFAATGDCSKLWEAHRVGMRHPYSHIEKLANLGAMPAKGAYIACFPVLIQKASAGWSRCVGLIPEEQ